MLKQFMRFLQRQVKEDGAGLYANYGGYRLRPLKPKKTKFKKNDLVSMTDEKRYFPPAIYRIFNNAESYEIWQSIKR